MPHQRRDDSEKRKLAKQSCSVANQKISGNTVTWKVICKDGGSESKSDGSITNKGTTFNGTIHMP